MERVRTLPFSVYVPTNYVAIRVVLPQFWLLIRSPSNTEKVTGGTAIWCRDGQ